MADTKTAGKLLEEWRSTVLLVAQTEMAKSLKSYADQHKLSKIDCPDYNRLMNVIKGQVVMRQSELDFVRLVFDMEDGWYQKISAAIKEDTAAKIKNAKKKKADTKATTQTAAVFEAWLDELGLFPKELYEQLELAKYGWTLAKINGIIEAGFPMKTADIDTLNGTGKLSEEYYQKFTEAIQADKAAKWEKKAEEEPKVEPEGKEQPRAEPKAEIVVPSIKKVDPPIKEPEKVRSPKTKNNYALAVILGIGALLVIVVLIVSINNQPPIVAVPTATQEVGTPPAYATELHRQISEAATACVGQGKVFINRDDREFQCVTPTP